MLLTNVKNKLKRIVSGATVLLFAAGFAHAQQVNLTAGPTNANLPDGSSVPSPSHDNQGTTWPIANAGPVFTPPAQGNRVQSFSTEVAAGATTSLTWTKPNTGTYLLESGTHPSIQATMGLVGMVVVTAAPDSGNAGTAYPGVSYNYEAPLLFSEIDPVQNTAVDHAVRTAGFSESA